MSPGKTSGAKSPKGKKEITVFDLLKQDHDKVRDLFGQIEENEEGERREELFSGLKSSLQEHLQLEEELFYPVLEKSEDAREKALEAYEEHNVAKTVLGEFSNVDPKDDRWDAKMKVLKEIVYHHLQEEEKNTFKTARKALEKDQIQQITEQIRQKKSEIEKKAA